MATKALGLLERQAATKMHSKSKSLGMGGEMRLKRNVSPQNGVNCWWAASQGVPLYHSQTWANPLRNSVGTKPWQAEMGIEEALLTSHT